MLQILLTILKILGIAILVILGIILTVILVVLFVPFRYRGDMSFDGKPKGGVLVSWLLHFITVRVEYDGIAAKALVKVLWFKLFYKIIWPAEEIEEDMTIQSTAETETVPVRPVVTANEVTEVQMSNSQQFASSPDSEPEIIDEQNVSGELFQEEMLLEKTPSEEPLPEAKPSKFERVKTFLEKLVFKLQSVVTKLIEKIQTVYQNLSAKYTSGQEKIDTICTFLADQENQNTIRLILRQVKRLLKHVLPRKIKGRVKFGFDDPATTGQILSYISPFYGMYAKSVAIEPVFDEKVLDGELHLKGHIRIGSLLWIIIRVVFNKNFRTLLKKFINRSK